MFSIFEKLFGGRLKNFISPFRIGDRVRDTWGNKHTVIAVDPGAADRLGSIRTRRDDGVEFRHAIIAHDLTRLLPEEAAPLPAKKLSIERVKPEQSSAGAYLRAGKIILCGTCITNIGGLDCGPYVVLESNASDAEVGTAILSVLSAARSAPIPSDLKQEQQKLFRTVGVPSSARFNTGALYCSIWQKPEVISITPSKNEGRHFSFYSETHAVRVPQGSQQGDIGGALRQGFARCT